MKSSRSLIRHRLFKKITSIFTRRRRKVVSGLSMVIILILAGYYLLGSDIFILRNIVVESPSSRFVSAVDIQDYVNYLLASSIFSIDTQAIEVEIENNWSEIDSVVVEKILPETLKINYVEYQPVLVIENEGVYRYVSKEGVIVHVGESWTDNFNSLPKILVNADDSNFGDLVLGHRVINEDFTKLLEVAKYPYDAANLKIEEMDYSDSVLHIVIIDKSINQKKSGGFKVQMDLMGDVGLQIEKLLAVVGDSRRNNHSLAEVDLRFERAVIRYR